MKSVQPTPKNGGVRSWVNTKAGCIVAVAFCLLFITIFIADIVMNGKWINVVFIILYGLILNNRLARLRSLHGS